MRAILEKIPEGDVKYCWVAFRIDIHDINVSSIIKTFEIIAHNTE